MFCYFEKKSIGNPENLGDFTGEFFLDVRAVVGDSCSTEDMRTPDIIRLHAKNMEVTL